MKKNYLIKLLCLFLFTGLSYNVFAVAETENNDTWNVANAITLGATGTGTAGTGQNQDWWKVTSSDDGKLTVNWTATNGLYIWCQVYDTLGTVQFVSTYTASSNTVNVDGLTAGTYYIKFFAYYSNEAPTYSFVPSWTTPAQANDQEPNGLKGQAKNLPVNSSKTGHIGYYYNNLDDTLDWYKVTTTQDGMLKWTITSHNGQNVYAQLYDNNGTTLFGGNYTTGTATFTQDGLSAGTYYLRIKTFFNSEFAPYTITDSLILPPVANDAEPNGTYPQALTFNLNDTVRGHIGYFYNNLDDTLDWYKVTTVNDGRLDFTMFSLNAQNVYLNLYDGNGTTVLGGNYTTGTATYSVDGLAAGTYYFRIRNYYISEWSPYKFIVKLVQPAQTIDAEPNGNTAQAITIGINDSVVGHIGYYYNALRDTFDWRKVTLANNGKLEWTITSNNGQNVYAELFDNNGTTDLGGNYTTTTATFSKDGLAPGTYYLRVRCYYINSEFAPYTLKTKFTGVAEDPEPNGTYALAKTLPLNGTFNGNFGYYYNGVRDTNDWLKLTTTNDGQLSISYTSNNGGFLRMIVYDNDGVTELYNDYTTTTKNYTRNDLGKGTYYVRLKGYYSYDFVPYTIVNTLTSQLTNDVEYNGKAANAIHVGGYKSKTGHINYYYNNQKDTADWYKVKLVLAGNLQVKVDKSQHTFDANYPDMIYKIYSDTTLAPFATNNLIGATPSYTFNHNGIAAGTYWIKLERSAATFGAYKITTNYKDTASATIALTSSSVGTSGACNTGAATYFVTRGIPPYSVQLFLDGVATGAPVVTNDTAKFTGLAPGAYYATVKCTGAVTSVTTSSTKGLVAKPKSQNAINITGTTAIIKWAAFACVDGFIVSYKKTADPTYISDTLGSGLTKDTLKNLSLSTSYDYKVAAYTIYNGVKYISGFTGVKSFTTLAARMENTASVDLSDAGFIVAYPNPTSDVVTLDLSSIGEVSLVQVFDVTGRNIISEYPSTATLQMDLSAFSEGIYSVLVTDASGNIFRSKIIKQ